MPFLNFPNISAEIKIKKEEVLNLLLASIAFEELGLAHIINAEVEKLQYIFNNFEKNRLKTPTIEELIQINRVTRKVFRTAINNHILLKLKLEDILDIATTKATTATTINDMISTSNTSSAANDNNPSCRLVSSSDVPINRGVSVVLHNNEYKKPNITINSNNSSLSRNSNVIKTTKTSASIRNNTFP